MAKSNIRSFLETLPVFRNLKGRALAGLIEESDLKEYQPGESIIKFGQPILFTGVIIEGLARAVVDGPEEYGLDPEILNPGDFIGEISLVTGEPSCVDVSAVEKCSVLFFQRDIFSEILASSPKSATLLAGRISDSLRARKDNPSLAQSLRRAWSIHLDPYGLNLRATSPMKLLVINCGSSSLKYNIFDTGDPSNNARGLIERIGEGGTRQSHESRKGKVEIELSKADHAAAFDSMLKLLTDPDTGTLADLSEISAAAHRVVHGGDKYTRPVVIDQSILEEISALSHLAPLHNPVNVLGIRLSMHALPSCPQIAVFDTAFHGTMPSHAHLYGLPYEYYSDHGIRRYGFHGLSHQYVGLRAAEHMRKPFSEIRLITCHLGNGASICAIDHGRSADTSMGLTPTEGLLMGTRCGDLDPAAIIYLQRNLGLAHEEVDELLNRESGLKGVSGVSNDLREIESAAEAGDRRALLAKTLFCYRLKKYIGSYAAAIGGLDALVFTGGIGEGSRGVRARACQGLEYMGIKIDEIKNSDASPARGGVLDISEAGSAVKVLVIPTDEERMIAREAVRTLEFSGVSGFSSIWKNMPIRVDVSIPHVHLCRADMNILFGKGYERSSDSRHGTNKDTEVEITVDISGPKGGIERVPVRGRASTTTQVELCATDCFKLGIDAPVRPSGLVARTPGLTLIGPAGSLNLKSGVICPQSHIHMPPEKALLFGLRDQDMVTFRVDAPGDPVLRDVLVRVDPDSGLVMHVNSHDAEAISIKTGLTGFIEAIHDRR